MLTKKTCSHEEVFQRVRYAQLSGGNQRDPLPSVNSWLRQRPRETDTSEPEYSRHIAAMLLGTAHMAFRIYQCYRSCPSPRRRTISVLRLRNACRRTHRCLLSLLGELRLRRGLARRAIPIVNHLHCKYGIQGESRNETPEYQSVWHFL